MASLHEDFGPKLEALQALLREQYGLETKVGEGFRDPFRQGKLYQQGRSTPGPIVTNAPSGSSYHNYGAAADLVPTNMSTKEAEALIRQAFQKTPETGLTWGGSFKSIYDPFHVQLGVPLNTLRGGQVAAATPAPPADAPTEASAQRRTPMPNMPSILGGQPGAEMPAMLGGALNNPQVLAGLELMVRSLNPWSKVGNSLSSTALAEQRAQLERLRDQRNHAFDREKFDFLKTDKTADNERADKGQFLTDDIKMFEYAKRFDNFKGTFAQWQQQKRAGAGEYGMQPIYGTNEKDETVILQLGKSGDTIQSKLPPGVKLTPGVERIDLGTEWGLFDKKAGAIVGRVPKDIEGKESAEERGKAQGQAQVSLPATLTKIDYSLKLVDDLIAHPGRGTGTGMSSRLDPRNIIPGTDAYNFGVRAKQVEGRAFLDAFESLRGGGAITETEGAKATQAVARLNTAQSDEEYKVALGELQSMLRSGRENAIRKAARSGQPRASEPPPTQSSPSQTETKTIGEKTYFKYMGKWYEK